MTQDAFDPTRRAGIAGATGMMLALVTRTTDASESPGGKGPCCGNGPPLCKKYGIGIQITTPETAGPDFSFSNPVFGKDKGNYFWVFVPDLSVTVSSYTGPGSETLHFYVNPTGFSGIVFCVAPAYTLVLTWPVGDQPSFSTRALGAME